jgi:two-component system, cell cycle sensor histidine kinase and response regulator CckA
MAGQRAEVGARTTILVVEDNEAVRALIGKALASMGSRLLFAGSAAEAAAVAAGAHIDLLLTDVVLPGATGIKLATKLVAERPALRVMYITGWQEHSALADIPDGVPLLKKPFDLSELALAVARALGTNP